MNYADDISEIWDIFNGIRCDKTMDDDTIELADSICHDLNSAEINIRKLDERIAERERGEER